MTPSASLLDHARRFYIDGAWTDPARGETTPIIDPATEGTIGTLALGSAEDVERAVRAARAAFETYAGWTIAQRQALLARIIEGLEARREELAHMLSLEMGAPLSRCRS